MKTLVIYDSAFGNTKMMAEAMAGELGAEIVYVSEARKKKLTDYELLIIGSPIQGWQPLPAMAGFLSGLKKDSLKGVKAATLDTRVSLFIHGDATEKMAAELSRAGAEVIDKEYFYVKGSKGPFKKGELDRAIAWATSLK